MSKIWTTGITVKNSEDGWCASCKWRSGEFAKSGYMEGEIATRYYEPTITQAIDYVLEFMDRMGVKKSDEIEEMKDVLDFDLYYEGYEDEEDCLPSEIQNIIKDEAEHRGWKCYIEE